MIYRHQLSWLVGLAALIHAPSVFAQAEQMLAAAKSGDLATVTELLEENPLLVAVKGEEKLTPIQLATMNLHTEVVEKLLAHGAELLHHTKDGAPLIHLALLRRDESSNDAEQRRALIGLLIKYGADVHSTDYLGKTPIHFAVMHGHYTVLDSLVIDGANLMARDSWQMTPMHVAAMYGQIPMIDWLVSRRVPVNVADSRKETPLHAAVRRARPKSVERLIQFKILYDAKSHNGQTALHLTGIAGPEDPQMDEVMKEIAGTLIAAGADVNAVDSAGRTPLYYALQKKRQNLADFLRLNGGKSLVPGG